MSCRKIGVTEETCYRWRRKYDGMKEDQAKRMKALEKENARRCKVGLLPPRGKHSAVAELTLDKQILAEATKGNS